jgi:hypothetical protein
MEAGEGPAIASAGKSAIGASRPLRRVPAIVSFLNPQPALSLGGGNFPGEKQNLPVVRFGSISAMPSEPLWVASPTRPAFLVETRSLGGMSGAPVLFHTDPYYMGPRKPISDESDNKIRVYPSLLIGLIRGTYPGNSQSDWTEEIVGADERFNTGISIVLPISQIIETVNQQVLHDSRQASIAAR